MCAHQITMIWRSTSFHQVHLVILENNLFQLLSSFPDPNPNFDMISLTWLKCLQSSSKNVFNPLQLFKKNPNRREGGGGAGFPNSGNKWGELEILQGGFFYQAVGTWGGGILTNWTFFNAKNSSLWILNIN